ncbi:MAG: SDR family oxidoreductase [Clostridia bacterium]|nr:SDR family oxidoreductase [Clostridia bacterium]
MIRKTAIITGGFGDIGKATAEKFAQNGYNIALTYLNSFDAGFIAKLKTYGIEVLALYCDQRSESDIINFVNSAFKEFEYVDVAVLNAGKAETEALLSEKETEEIDDILTVNLRGTILFAREIAKKFLSQKHGNIVMISSVYGQTGGSMESVYSASKAGIIGLSKSLAVELSPYIRVNCVSPGYIDTKMNTAYSKDTVKYIKNETPLERLGEPTDIANAIYFLSSDESSFITGVDLTVSGGIVKF